MGEDGSEGMQPPQEVVEAEQTPGSGVEKFVAKLQKPTSEQRELLKQSREQAGDQSQEVRAALAAERSERIGENLPDVVDFYQDRFQARLAELRADPNASNPEDHRYASLQHDIKVTKDLQTLLGFQSWGEGVTDEQAQGAALKGTFALMYDSLSHKGESRDLLDEERRIRESGDTSSPEVQQKLQGLQELKGRYGTLVDDLYENYNYHPWFNLKATSRVLNRNAINDYRVEENSRLRDNVATNVDGDYYKAWFAEDGRWDPVRKQNPELNQRITSKWETPPAQAPQPVAPAGRV